MSAFVIYDKVKFTVTHGRRFQRLHTSVSQVQNCSVPAVLPKKCATVSWKRATVSHYFGGVEKQV
uniref:Uncharacterized protein n=1 Tax=Myoviridae sp. ctt8G1 TaxID=2827713 RepID=A0A8S5TFY4_9CAUD|nr:MAG TPA: hypothetical protein [Myoviridae sp. ctt8G1]